LLEEEKMTSFQLFGREVRPAVAAKTLGGKCLLWGNLDPVLLLEGPQEKIREATNEFLQALGPCGGIILGDGANVCPGTPIENLRVVVEAAEQYAREHTELFDGQ
jgi:uroporphyrinogen-III decarboxylase